MHQHRTSTLTLVAAAVLAASGTVSGSVPEPVLFTDDQAPIPVFGPGTFSGGSFGADYGINGQGDLLINAGIRWDAPPFFFYTFILNNGLYIPTDDGLLPIVVGGEPIPFAGPDEVYFVSDAQNWNDLGSTVFVVAGVAPIGEFGFEARSGFLLRADQSGVAEIIATRLDPDSSPELPSGLAYQSFGVLSASGLDGNVRLNNDGDIAFVATLNGPGVDTSNDEVLMRRSDGPLSIQLREGEPAPGLPASTVIGSSGGTVAFTEPKLNDLGEVVLLTRVTGPSVIPGNDQAIYAFSDSGPTLVAAATIDDPSGERIRSLRDPETNDLGQVLFRGLLGPILIERQALFLGVPGDAQPLIESGDPRPGLEGFEIDLLIQDGASAFTLPIAQPILDGVGRVLFAADLAGPGITPFTVNKRALFFGEPDDLQLVVRAGDDVPNLPGATFTSVGEFAVNRTGLVVFTAILDDNNQPLVSLWAWDADQGLRLVARENQALTIRGGGTLVSSFVGFRGGSGQQGGLSSQVSDDGRVLFDAAFPSDAAGGESFGIYLVDMTPDGEPCPGDVTGDGAINLEDLNLVLANFGVTTAAGDTNGDGVIDLADLNTVLASFGAGCP